MDMQFTAQDLRVVADSRVYEGHFAVRRISLQHRLFAGGWSETLEREVFERGGAVGVLPWDPVRDELVMLEQFRVGALRGADSPWMMGNILKKTIHRRISESGLSLAISRTFAPVAKTVTSLRPVT